jgi:phthiodiolone/phenolphthiodiolone dimycocerosates ketoreductase
MAPNVETAVPFIADRHLDPRLAGPFAVRLETSRVVDFYQTWDQLTSWWPRALWTRDNTPLAGVIEDCDSFQDAFISAAFAAAHTNTLGSAISTDAIRNQPAELLQRLLTLAGNEDRRRPILMLGAGEIKQTKPFGYSRSEGLSRLEDTLYLLNQLANSKDLVSYQGHHLHYDEAWIGGSMKNPPRVLAMGGGPRLMEMATKHADGFVSVIPLAFANLDKFSAVLEQMRRLLDQHGRNPDNFTFGLWHMVLMHEDEDELERMCDNRLLRWIAAAFGRFHPAEWREEGITPPFPDGWHYALKLLPAKMSQAEVDDIIERTSPEMVRRSFHVGTPDQVAAQIKPFIDAGATFASVFDMAPTVRPLDRAPESLERVLEVCRILKS